MLAIWVRRCVAVAALATPLVVRAQTVRGTVVDTGGRPVVGVVVLLVDSTARATARSLSSETGDFRLAAPRPGTYRVRTLRIGYRPVSSEPVTIVAGGEVTQRIVVTSLPIGLDTMRVAGQNVCRAFADSGAATYAVWEQIRTALTAAELTAGSRTIAATTVTYDRSIDPRSSRNGGILRQQASVSTEYVTRAWRTLPPDTLHRVGYVVTDRSNTVTYYAPGLDMLLSPVFVEDHCFRLVTDSKRPGLVGIAFEAIPERRRGPAEIRGTLWVDRPSSELRELEFRYMNVLKDQEDYAGGGVSFARMRNGAWAISRWEIRMPVIVQDIRPGHGAETRVSEIRVNGGQLVLARRGTDTLWTGPRLTLRGSLADSASDSPVAARLMVAGPGRKGISDARGRFAISELLPGEYSLEIRTASLDSMNAVHRVPVTVVDSTTALELRVPSGQQLAAALCGKAAGVDGIVVGTLRVRGTGAPALRGGRVVAEWSANASDSTRVRRLETPGSTDGSFRLCGVPMSSTITLRASSDSAETDSAVVVRFPSGSRLARAELTLERTSDLALRGATFTGIVVADSTKQPLVGAEVVFPELGKTTLTDANGAFRVLGIPSGEQHLMVRRLGYGAADTRITFTGRETVERRVVLGKSITLDAMVVSEKAFDRYMPGFEENRRLGLGHFLTRAEFDKYKGMRLGTVLQQVPGLGVISGRGHEWVASKHTSPPLCPGPIPSPKYYECLRNHGLYVPEQFEGSQGMAIACYTQVYLDGALQNGFREPTEPFDINTIAPERVEAVEYYAGPAQTPLKYSRPGSGCGVLVIWTRRAP